MCDFYPGRQGLKCLCCLLGGGCLKSRDCLLKKGEEGSRSWIRVLLLWLSIG